MSLSARSKLAAQLAVYFVADPEQAQRDLSDDVAAAIAGGVTMVQLRAKAMDDAVFRSLAIEILAICRARDVPFIVNDRFEVAREIGADGVHLGELDLPLDEARQQAGASLIIGSSPQDVAQAAAARERGGDYVGLGPIYATGSKNDAGDPIGLTGLAARIAAAKLPAVGIGGISATNATEIILAGADGVAVISAIQRAPDPQRAAAELAAAVRAGFERRL